MRFPDLKENQVIIPRTTKLTFNISLSGTDKNRTLVKNLGRNIIKKLVVKLKGEIVIFDDCDIFYSYHDPWKTKNERRNAVFQGIVKDNGRTENATKHRKKMLAIKHQMQGMKQWHQFSLIKGMSGVPPYSALSL